MPSTFDLPNYKTSSTIVNPFFSNFTWEVIAEFFDANSAYDFEQELIFNNWGDPLLLNQKCHYGKSRWRHNSNKSQKRTKDDFTDEWKANISKSKKGISNGDANPMYGKTHSEESRSKISASRKAKAGTPGWNVRPPCSDEKAAKIKLANTGKKWIHNKSTKERKYLDPSLVENYIKIGWELGLGPKKLF